MNERFFHWQCFRTPPGFATTKNPVEQINRVLKRDYTAHRLLETGELLQQLASCCSNRSIDVRPFSESPGTSKELLSRVKALRGKQLLREFVLPRMSADFLLVDSRNDVFHVLYTPPNRIYNTTSNSAHEAIQVSAQPVDMVTQTCPCAYHFKYTNCVHRIFAMQERARIDSNGDDVLVNRRVSKRKRAAIGPAPVAAGRPSLVGPALQLE
ncbi:hypothetical protein L915_08450 [Phytophthora nicotianae]|uniref:SWIM-type domain-containing protein n=1 Tax=Phytophthora nicotianae TaxID=4792 RepID=W2GVN4_PHYNI|nr:hypothetical protein L915_08450 [Phytophthora nicotianae]ETL40437.1 hypothetical protein L916_08378 [Phytophthora nicotianae]